MLERAGYETGYELAGLIDAGRRIGEVIGKPPVSALSRAGPFPAVS
jgi:hydroxymethylglutaryl-CoA lyase